MTIRPSLSARGFLILINASLTKKSEQLPAAVLSTIDSLFRAIILSVDAELPNAALPPITAYYKDLYTIFGRFLGHYDFENACSIVERCLANDVSGIDLKFVDSVHYFIKRICNKWSRSIRVVQTNYSFSYFRAITQ